MESLAEECLSIINNGQFRVVEPGPLHAPIHKFSLHRNEKLTLILETDADPKATSTDVSPPPGTVRFNTERTRLVNSVGVEAELVGIISYSVREAGTAPLDYTLKESAQVHFATVTPGDTATAAYTIDWLQNLPASPFVWPDPITTTTTTTKSQIIGLIADGGLTISSDNEQFSLSYTAAKLTVSGVTKAFQ